MITIALSEEYIKFIYFLVSAICFCATEKHKEYWILLVCYLFIPSITTEPLIFIVTEYSIQLLFIFISVVLFINNRIQRYWLILCFCLVLFNLVCYFIPPHNLLFSYILFVPDRVYFEILISLPIISESKLKALLIQIVSVMLITSSYLI